MTELKGYKKFVSQYKKGDIIFTREDKQEHFYIINKGRVQLKIGEAEIPIVSLDAGEFFGEESLIENQQAAFTVEAIEEADIIKLPFSALTEMMKKNNEISQKILKKLAEKNLKIFDNLLRLKDKQVTPERVPAAPDSAEETTSEKLNPETKAYLVMQRSNRVVQLTKKTTFLGRRDYTTGFVPDVDLTKEDEEKYISRKHSKIQYIDGKFYLSEEPGAINGTFLNGNKLTTGVKYELNNEDELTLCHLNIIFKF